MLSNVLCYGTITRNHIKNLRYYFKRLLFILLRGLSSIMTYQNLTQHDDDNIASPPSFSLGQEDAETKQTQKKRWTMLVGGVTAILLLAISGGYRGFNSANTLGASSVVSSLLEGLQIEQANNYKVGCFWYGGNWDLDAGSCLFQCNHDLTMRKDIQDGPAGYYINTPDSACGRNCEDYGKKNNWCESGTFFCSVHVVPHFDPPEDTTKTHFDGLDGYYQYMCQSF